MYNGDKLTRFAISKIDNKSKFLCGTTGTMIPESASMWHCVHYNVNVSEYTYRRRDCSDPQRRRDVVVGDLDDTWRHVTIPVTWRDDVIGLNKGRPADRHPQRAQTTSHWSVHVTGNDQEQEQESQNEVGHCRPIVRSYRTSAISVNLLFIYLFIMNIQITTNAWLKQ